MGEAWAQAGDAGGPPAIFNVGFLLAMLAIFYFVLLRPEQRRRREHEKLVSDVKRNDLVVLSCGLHGRVMALAEKVVTVEIAPKVQVQFDRSAIQTVETMPSEGREKEREKS